MDTSIIDFLKTHRCANISCIDNDGSPYSFSCFYAFNSKDGLLYYKTSGEAFHSQAMSQNRQVSGTILPDKLNSLAIQGIQFKGVVVSPGDPAAKSTNRYYKRFPFALAMPGEIWIIKLNWIKFTDNTKGFGTKIKWERLAEVAV